MPLLPLELLIKIGRNLSSISAKSFFKTLGHNSTDKDREIWSAIFNNEK
jgi:hypothetical protein